MHTMTAFLEHFRRQRRATRKLVASIPDAHFTWAPTRDAFSCADVVRHMMQAEVFWRRLKRRHIPTVAQVVDEMV